MEGSFEALKGMAKFHLNHGTTTMYPTTNTASLEKIFSIIDFFKKIRLEISGPNLPGVHLEGPFISEFQAGAMNMDFICKPKKEDINVIKSYSDVIARITAAPEVEGTLEMAKNLKDTGIVMSAGHSNATYEDMLKAMENGYSHITHLFSATSTVRRVNAYRVSGIIETAFLQDELTVEIIGDLRHLPVELVKLIYKIKGSDKTALITDAMFAAGCDNDRIIYGIGDRKIIIEDGVAKLPDRSAFAGSITTLDKMLKNMVLSAEIPLNEAVKMATITPAKIMGISNKKGTISEGMDADIVVMDMNFNIKVVIVEGKIIYLDL